MELRKLGASVLLSASLAFVLAACSSSDGGDAASPEAEASSDMAGDTGGGGGVPTTLADFSITLDSEDVPEGMTTFDITNEGPALHELVVLKTDTDAGDLPVGADNTVDEAGMDLVDEVEDIEPGATASLEVDLKAGHYALICNIPGHYELGMFANLTVS